MGRDEDQGRGEPAAAMMRLARPGGVTRAAPSTGPPLLTPFLPSPAWALATTAPPILTLCPPAPAPSTCSTSCPARAGPPPPSPAPHGTRNASVPGQIQAGSLPPPAASNSPSQLLLLPHSSGAAGDTSRRGGRGAAWSGSGRLSAHCARGTSGLVVLSLRAKRSHLR